MSDTTSGRKKQDFESVLDESDTSVASFEPEKRGFVGGLQHFLHSAPTMVPVIVLVVSVAALAI